MGGGGGEMEGGREGGRDGRRKRVYIVCGPLSGTVCYKSWLTI